MGDEPSGLAGPDYRAFISYSHADRTFATWLHRKLESARLPDRSRLAPVFIDRAELAAGPDLSAQVRAALAGSRALVVVASPAARASRWVSQEIELFRSLHPDRPVYAALIEGEPDVAFPAPLLIRDGQPVEPLAADFRKGQDGRRLGLLKIVAGLSAQPLDRLVQRDAQARQRRVMAVTAGAVILSLILSVLLAVALRARAEAERQRAEAEGLVEFMLTDLRDKLKGVGRLSVMASVNQRALAYYEDEEDLSSLPPDSLARRARAIAAMGEIDEALGKPLAALPKYQELHRVTAAQLAAKPNDPARIFAHATSENRLGLIQTTLHRNDLAVPHLRESQRLLRSLPWDQPKPTWIRLRSLVSGNLCAIAVENRSISKRTLEDCEDAIAQAKRHLQLVPQDLSAQYDLTFHLLWLGDVHEALGSPVQATAARNEAALTANDLVRRDPTNMLWREQRMETAFKLATIALAAQDRPAFQANLATAKADNAILVRHDPENRYWSGYTSRLQKLESEASK